MSADTDTARPVVLVTGAAGGLGQALVRAFAVAGWRVAAAGHSSRPPAGGPEIWPCQLDVTDGSQVAATVEAVLERWEHLDVLVNNAGVIRDVPLARMSDEAWDRVLDVSLKGAFLCARAVLPGMIRRGDGHILNVASLAARAGARGQANYSAAKAGLIGFTLSLAREVGPNGVRSNAVLPGLLPTPMTAELPATVLDGFVAANVLGRINSLAEVARLIVCLAETRDVSGQVLQLDGRIARWT